MERLGVSECIECHRIRLSVVVRLTKRDLRCGIHLQRWEGLWDLVGDYAGRLSEPSESDYDPEDEAEREKLEQGPPARCGHCTAMPKKS
jgi:hypothetical protein